MPKHGGAFGVGFAGEPAGAGNQVGDALVAIAENVFAGVQNLPFDADALLHLIVGTGTDVDAVVGLQFEAAGFGIEGQIAGHAEKVDFGELVAALCGCCFAHNASVNFDARFGSGGLKTIGTQYEVFEGHAFAVLVRSAGLHFAADKYVAGFAHIVDAFNDDLVFGLQGHVRSSAALEHFIYVEGNDAEIEIVGESVHYGPSTEHVGFYALGFFDELQQGHAFGELIVAGAPHGAADADAVFKAIKNLSYFNHIAVLQCKTGILFFVDGQHYLFGGGVAFDAYAAGKGGVGEGTGHLDQITECFVGQQFVQTGAAYLTGNFYPAFNGGYAHYVLILKANVGALVAAQQHIVDVHGGYPLVVAEDFDLAVGANGVGSACHIQGVEEGGEGGQGVGAWTLYFANEGDLDAAYAPEAYPGKGGGCSLVGLQSPVELLECVHDANFRLLYGEAVDIYGAEVVDLYGSFGADGELVQVGGGAPNVDDELVAGSKDVVHRGGNIHGGLEGLIAAEYGGPENEGTGCGVGHFYLLTGTVGIYLTCGVLLDVAAAGCLLQLLGALHQFIGDGGGHAAGSGHLHGLGGRNAFFFSPLYKTFQLCIADIGSFYPGQIGSLQSLTVSGD